MKIFWIFPSSSSPEEGGLATSRCEKTTEGKQGMLYQRALVEQVTIFRVRALEFAVRFATSQV